MKDKNQNTIFQVLNTEYKLINQRITCLSIVKYISVISVLITQILLNFDSSLLGLPVLIVFILTIRLTLRELIFYVKKLESLMVNIAFFEEEVIRFYVDMKYEIEQKLSKHNKLFSYENILWVLLSIGIIIMKKYGI